MTPGARVQAAIEIIDTILGGVAAERALTSWARRSRHAGSKDRAAVRDHVFDALRRFRSAPALGCGEDGRAWMVGLFRSKGQDPTQVFTGEGYAPEPLRSCEEAYPEVLDRLVALDCPELAAETIEAGLGSDFAKVMEVLRHRAPVFLRVNVARTDMASARRALSEEGVATEPHPLSPTALRVVEGARKVARSAIYERGEVELQDAASQAVVDRLPLQEGARVLDFCAGGGGKTLAMAGRVRAQYSAHDAVPGRLADLYPRAARAGVQVDVIDTVDLPQAGPFDLVLADAPCSGSGAWRRSPDAKRTFSKAALALRLDAQREVLRQAASLVAPGGVLAYATCSFLPVENRAQIDGFLDRSKGWDEDQDLTLSPLSGGDGFYLSLLRRR